MLVIVSLMIVLVVGQKGFSISSWSKQSVNNDVTVCDIFVVEISIVTVSEMYLVLGRACRTKLFGS